MNIIEQEDIGLVVPKTFVHTSAFSLESGEQLPGFVLVYETYGTFTGDNAILVCHALSGDHHAAGRYKEEDKKPGWWDNFIGPGKAIDTNVFFVVSLNNLGGCSGSTGPTSINEKNGREYGPDFPFVTVRDWVRSQNLLRQYLQIDSWHAVIGGSLGGMQALQWAVDFPDLLQHAVIIAAAPRLTAQNIAFNDIARQAIQADPDFCNGNYSRKKTRPLKGIMLARMLGHVTYLSDYALSRKFGRSLRNGQLGYGLGIEFEIESYLHYQAKTFAQQFDANSYLLMTRALDYFDPAKEFGNDLVQTVSGAQCNFCVVAFTTDWRFSPQRSEELVTALLRAKKNVSYVCIDSGDGHDSFLLVNERYHNTVHLYLKRSYEKKKS